MSNPNSPASPTPLQQALAGIADPERRAWLAEWAAQNQVRPNDPLWAVLAISLMNEQWSRENIDRLEQATAKLLHQIDHATVRGQQRVTERAAAATQVAEDAMVGAMDRLAAETAISLRASASQAIRNASVGGFKGWVLPILPAVLVGAMAVFAVPVAQTYAQRTFGADVQALEIGLSFLSTWKTLPDMDRRQVLQLLHWQGKAANGVATDSTTAEKGAKGNPNTP